MSLSLNPPQAEAVATTTGPLLVFAGAGSGKTRVITYRVANLVSREHVAPYRILAVTFTNKAAGEMKKRLEGLLGFDIAKDLAIGTFHATSARLLRRHGEPIGIPRNFTIYDSDDQKAVVTRIIREFKLDEKRYPPRVALHRIHQEKQEGRGPDEMSVDGYLDQALVKIFREYEKRLRSANAVDFEDLIGLTVKLAEHPEFGAPLRRKFSHVLVDEFQDTNRMQYRLIKALSSMHNNVCVVGDDDQSIYRWRGADVRNIRGFRTDFPDVRVVKLEENYRSTANIVQGALAVISRSAQREPKNLFTSNDAGEPIHVVSVSSEHEEAHVVLKSIEAARAEGISNSEIAVFYRIHAQSRVLEEVLRSRRIPYQVVGGMKFYERAEIKDALCYMRVLVNPKSDVDVLRIINVPARGIGDTTVERLVAFARSKDLSVLEAVDLIEGATEIAGAAKKRLLEFRELFKKIKAGALDGSYPRPPSEVLTMILERTGYREILRAEKSPEADARLENLAELVGSLKDFEDECEAAGEVATLETFLERVSLVGVDDNTEAERVSLMTVHAAKGLEFDWVLLTGMEEEMFPYRGMQPGGEEELEEERRLAYVAMTRAKKRLILTHAQTRQIFGQTRWGRPSRFVSDLPEANILQMNAHGEVASRDSDVYEPVSDDVPSISGRISWGPNRPPSVPPKAAPTHAPGERFVDREFFADDSHDGDSSPIQKGSRVLHDRFGEGKVISVANVGEPAVVAYFPGWGEKKVLARFLKLG